MSSAIEQEFAKLDSLSGPTWLREHRKESFETFKKLGIPNRKDEQWKYTNAKAFAADEFSLSQHAELPSIISTSCVEILAEDINLVFVNGQLNEDLSQLSSLPEGLEISLLEDSWDDLDVQDAVKKSSDFENAFEAQNHALMEHGLVIKAAKNTAISETIHLVFVNQVNGDSEILSSPSIFVICDRSAELSIRESHVGDSGAKYISSSSVFVEARQNAKVGLYKFQNQGDDGRHLDHTQVIQKRDSKFETFNFSLGGKLLRNDLRIRLEESGADAVFNGVYMPCNGEHVDSQSTVDHQSPHCTSSQLYKGVLRDGSRAVFNGKVLIRRDAQQTDAKQLNNNLLLSENVEIDTKPQMEIDADDVKCAHGATVGQMDEDELFYLQSRGINLELAKKMLSVGYLNEAVHRISNESVRNAFESILKKEFTDGLS